MESEFPPSPLEDETDARTLKGRSGFARIVHAAANSSAGLKAAYRGEAAFRQLLWLNVVLIPLAAVVDVGKGERVLLVLAPLASLVVELINSAIEATVDRVSLAIHPLSKRAKDMGSAAQMLALLLVALTWSIILG